MGTPAFSVSTLGDMLMGKTISPRTGLIDMTHVWPENRRPVGMGGKLGQQQRGYMINEASVYHIHSQHQLFLPALSSAFHFVVCTPRG